MLIGELPHSRGVWFALAQHHRYTKNLSLLKFQVAPVMGLLPMLGTVRIKNCCSTRIGAAFRSGAKAGRTGRP
jgi:hypothetical protein